MRASWCHEANARAGPMCDLRDQAPAALRYKDLCSCSSAAVLRRHGAGDCKPQLRCRLCLPLCHMLTMQPQQTVSILVHAEMCRRVNKVRKSVHQPPFRSCSDGTHACPHLSPQSKCGEVVVVDALLIEVADVDLNGRMVLRCDELVRPGAAHKPQHVVAHAKQAFEAMF
jgi:hypothetical protein